MAGTCNLAGAVWGVFIRRRAVCFVFSLITLLRTGYTQEQPGSTPSTQPNFIVVYCDNLGYGDIEPFGSEVNRTPYLNRMEREGRKFTHFYVTSGVCTPSRASIMTGCYAQRVGMHRNDRDGHVLRPISPYGLNPDEVTVAEVLKAAGYATGIIGKWHLGDQKPFLPTRQGFDYFYGIPYSDDMTQAMGQRFGSRLDGKHWPPLPVMLNEKVVQAGVDRNTLTRDYTEKALEFIETHREEPFFLYIPQAMPGSTEKPFSGTGFRGRSASGPWGDSVEELDWSTGQIMEKLEELGIAENTLLIFTSDNGSPMGEDLSGVERGTNRPLHGRGYTTSEGGFRVPALMWWPGTVPGGTVCTELATTMDLLPTFAGLAGAELPGERVIDGHDIQPLIEGKTGARTPYEVFYYYNQDQLQAVRRGPWKLFVPLDAFSQHPHFGEGEGGEPLLFNVAEDISSRHNVAAANPEVVKELLQWAEKAREDLGDKDRQGSGQRPPGKINNPVPVTEQKTFQLFNGQNLDGWYTFLREQGRDHDPDSVFTVRNGVIRIAAGEFGCITTIDEYENYRLVVEYKWGEATAGKRKNKARDNGVLVHSQGKDGAFGGNWMHSIECQIIEGGTGDFIVVGDGSKDFAITVPVAPEKQGNAYVFQPGGEPVTVNKGRVNWKERTPDWQDVKGFRGENDVENPVGEWNTLECVAEGPALSVYLNGRLVNHAIAVKPAKGHIQIQSEGAEMWVRRVELIPLLPQN